MTDNHEAVRKSIANIVAGYTPTQQRILEVLEDGKRHSRKELLQCLNDEMTGRGVLNSHLHLLRQKLRPRGTDIICELHNRSIGYRWVRLLGNPYRG